MFRVLSFLLLLLQSIPIGSTYANSIPAVINSAGAGGAFATNPSTTIALGNIVPGQVIVVYAEAGNITSWNTPSGCSLTFTAYLTPTTTSPMQGIWTATSGSTVSSCTVTISANSSSSSGLTGLGAVIKGTTSGMVGSSYGTASCTTGCTGGSVTTTVNNSIALTFIAYGSSVTFSSPSPFSFLVNGTDGAGLTRALGSYLQVTTGTYTPTWNSSSFAPNYAVTSIALHG